VRLCKLIDLLLGGSPCQGFSIAGEQLNFFDTRSKLFFDYVKALEELNPKYFLLENVKMKKEYRDVISRVLGVEPIEINSALVSAHRRERNYWTNIPGIQQPVDKGISMIDVIERSMLVPYRGNQNIKYVKPILESKVSKTYKIGYTGNVDSQGTRVYSPYGKSVTLQALAGGGGAKTGLYLWGDNEIYALNANACEVLQNLPVGYCSCVSQAQAIKSCGNGWTVDVIAHILSYIPETYLHTVISLFDGISCGQVALERAGKVYNQYYASEIDKYAIQVTQKNYPHTMQLGDVTKIDWEKFKDRVNIIQKVS
jgi:site-specific DNA-cytosine methylase